MKSNDKTNYSELFAGLANITQLGLSVIVPVVLCALLANFLKERFSIPDWLVIIIIALGFMAGIKSFIDFVKMYLKKLDKKTKGDD